MCVLKYLTSFSIAMQRNCFFLIVRESGNLLNAFDLAGVKVKIEYLLKQKIQYHQYPLWKNRNIKHVYQTKFPLKNCFHVMQFQIYIEISHMQEAQGVQDRN